MARSWTAFIVDWLNLLLRWAHLDRRHRLDRHVVLFHRARSQPAEARADARGRLRHRLGSAWRRLLSCREIPDRAEDAARRSASGSNGRPTSPGSPASCCSSCSTTGTPRPISSIPRSCRLTPMQAIVHLGRSACWRAGSSMTGSAGRRFGTEPDGARDRRLRPHPRRGLCLSATSFPAAARCIHVGAFIGTIMAANVFGVIIPNQKQDHRGAAARRGARSGASAPSASSARCTTTI